MKLITRRPAIRRIVIGAIVALMLGIIGSFATATSANAATKTCSASTPTAQLPELRRGDTGSCVKYAQGLLLAHEVMIGTGQPDGSFGPGTQTGVKNFQKWFKVMIYPDGIIGQNTWKALRIPYKFPS